MNNYSDTEPGSDCDGDKTSSFAVPMEQQYQQVYPEMYKEEAAPQFSNTVSKREQMRVFAEQYSDMDSDGDEDALKTYHDLYPYTNNEGNRLNRNDEGNTFYYSDMDSSGGESDGSARIDLTVNYAELFPVAESEQRATQIVANRRLEKDKSELIGGRNQDYIGLAKAYKFQRKYSDPRKNPPCVLCHSRTSRDVFFPCEHRCVCRECIQKENFCDERELQSKRDGYCLCPVCASIIKIVIPFDHGREVAKYWAWVEEVVPPLPVGFKRKFLKSAEVLHDIYVEKSNHDIIDEPLCKQS